MYIPNRLKLNLDFFRYFVPGSHRRDLLYVAATYFTSARRSARLRDLLRVARPLCVAASRRPAHHVYEGDVEEHAGGEGEYPEAGDVDIADGEADEQAEETEGRRDAVVEAGLTHRHARPDQDGKVT